MNITTISYSESIETFTDIGLHKWKKYGLEATLEEGESDVEASKELEKKVSSFLSNQPPDSVSTPTTQIKKEPKEQAIDSQIEELTVSVIQSCLDLPTLESYRLLVVKDRELKEAYDKKFDELKNKK